MQKKQAHRKGCFLTTWFLTLGGVAGALVAVVVLAFGLEVVLALMGSLLIVADPPVKTEAAVVLSGGEAGRMEEAARLYEDKLVGLIILTETGEVLPEYGSYSAIQRFLAMDLGIPAGAIVVTEQKATNTAGEARITRKLMQSKGLKSLTVVTDPYHSLRTRILFREEFKDSGIDVYIRPVRGHWYRSTTWWLSAEGRKATLTEYGGLARDILKIKLR